MLLLCVVALVGPRYKYTTRGHQTQFMINGAVCIAFYDRIYLIVNKIYLITCIKKTWIFFFLRQNFRSLPELLKVFLYV